MSYITDIDQAFEVSVIVASQEAKDLGLSGREFHEYVSVHTQGASDAMSETYRNVDMPDWAITKIASVAVAMSG